MTFEYLASCVSKLSLLWEMSYNHCKTNDARAFCGNYWSGRRLNLIIRRLSVLLTPWQPKSAEIYEFTHEIVAKELKMSWN